MWGGCPECPLEGGRRLTKRGHTRLNLPHRTPSGPTLPLVLLLRPGPPSRSGLLSTPTLGFLLDSWAACDASHPCYPAVALTKPHPPHPLAAKGGLRCMKPLGHGCHSCWGLKVAGTGPQVTLSQSLGHLSSFPSSFYDGVCV